MQIHDALTAKAYNWPTGISWTFILAVPWRWCFNKAKTGPRLNDIPYQPFSFWFRVVCRTWVFHTLRYGMLMKPQQGRNSCLWLLPLKYLFMHDPVSNRFAAKLVLCPKAWSTQSSPLNWTCVYMGSRDEWFVLRCLITNSRNSAYARVSEIIFLKKPHKGKEESKSG